MLLLLVILACIAIIILYISILHGKMKTQNDENIKLLDGMHEGLLILSKKDEKRIIFCNKPS